MPQHGDLCICGAGVHMGTQAPLTLRAVEVAVIGAGAAGLATPASCGAVAYRLSSSSERGEGVGESWRGRYDALHPTPCGASPGCRARRSRGARAGGVSRDGLVRYLERYAAANDVQVRTVVEVTGVERPTAAGDSLRRVPLSTRRRS